MTNDEVDRILLVGGDDNSNNIEHFLLLAAAVYYETKTKRKILDDPTGLSAVSPHLLYFQ